MRIFLVAVAVFALVTAVLVLNMWYVAHTTDFLLERLAEFPARADTAARDLGAFQAQYHAFYELISEREKLLHVLCGHTDTDRVRDAFFDMATRYIAGDNAGYTSAKGQLDVALNDLRDAERLSFDNFT